MRKSHKQKVIDRRIKRRRRWMLRRYPGVLKILRDNHYGTRIQNESHVTPPPEWAVKGVEWLHQNLNPRDLFLESQNP